MKIILASIHVSGSASGKAVRSRSKSAPTDALVDEYGLRITRFADWETQRFASEDALLDWAAKQQGRSPLQLILLDSRGVQYTSEVRGAGWNIAGPRRAADCVCYRSCRWMVRSSADKSEPDDFSRPDNTSA